MKIILAFLIVGSACCAQNLIDFQIEDQFKQLHCSSDYDGDVVVVIGSDKAGCDFDKLWAAELSVKLGNSAKILPVAHLKGVPFFLKGFIRGKFPKQPENWILLDWDGKFDEAYQFEDGLANILVFSGSGETLFRTSLGEIKPEVVSEIVSIVNNSMNVDKSNLKR